jgi:type II secretion system protein N
MGKRRKWFGYVVFVVVVVVFTLYFCFPSKTVQRYLEALASEAAPAFFFEIEGVRPALPFGLKADQVGFTYRDRIGNFLFKADSFVVMPSLRVLTSGKPSVSFDCRAYGGTIKGTIASGTFDFGGPYRSEIELLGILLDLYPALQEKLKRRFTGTMHGTLSYVWTHDSSLRRSGEADFSLVDGSIHFAKPFMDLQSMDFDRIDARMVLDDQMVSLDRFDFKGSQMKGTASGTVRLSNNFERSSLDLTVSVKPSTDFFNEKKNFFDAARFLNKQLKEDHFILHIMGTIAKPRVSFNQ